MTTTFQKIANRIQGSYMSIFFFLAGLTLMIVGINHFVEDTISSYYGIKMLETYHGMAPTTYPFTYFTISISPQIAQIVFFYIFINNPRQNWWALVIFGIASGFDFYSDVWYRSNEMFWTSWQIAAITSVMTFMVYTFGSELFISTGFGLTMELLAPAIAQFKKAANDIRTARMSHNQAKTTHNQTNPSTHNNASHNFKYPSKQRRR